MDLSPPPHQTEPNQLGFPPPRGVGVRSIIAKMQIITKLFLYILLGFSYIITAYMLNITMRHCYIIREHGPLKCVR